MKLLDQDTEQLDYLATDTWSAFKGRIKRLYRIALGGYSTGDLVVIHNSVQIRCVAEVECLHTTEGQPLLVTLASKHFLPPPCVPGCVLANSIPCM